MVSTVALVCDYVMNAGMISTEQTKPTPHLHHLNKPTGITTRGRPAPWLSSCTLSLLQNIIIAIVGNAYDDAKTQEGPVEYSLLYITWLRIK